MCSVKLARILCYVRCENRGWRKVNKAKSPFHGWQTHSSAISTVHQGQLQIWTNFWQFCAEVGQWILRCLEFQNLNCAVQAAWRAHAVDWTLLSSWYEEGTIKYQPHLTWNFREFTCSASILLHLPPKKNISFIMKPLIFISFWRYLQIVSSFDFSTCLTKMATGVLHHRPRLPLHEPHSSGDHCQISGAKLMREVVDETDKSF